MKYSWILVLFIIGCMTKGDNPTNVVKVTGKAVDSKGDPLRFVQLTFLPVKSGVSAGATTDANGNFVPRCLANQEGMIPGGYKVVVIPQRKTGATVSPKYLDESKTDLEVEVKEGHLTLRVP